MVENLEFGICTGVSHSYFYLLPGAQVLLPVTHPHPPLHSLNIIKKINNCHTYILFWLDWGIYYFASALKKGINHCRSMKPAARGYVVLKTCTRGILSNHLL